MSDTRFLRPYREEQWSRMLSKNRMQNVLSSLDQALRLFKHQHDHTMSIHFPSNTIQHCSNHATHCSTPRAALHAACSHQCAITRSHGLPGLFACCYEQWVCDAGYPCQLWRAFGRSVMCGDDVWYTSSVSSLIASCHTHCTGSGSACLQRHDGGGLLPHAPQWI